MKKFFLFCLYSSVIILSLNACCCSRSCISVFNESITQQTLASVNVNAPDPLHEKNPHGQRLYIRWSLPKKYENEALRGVLKIRFQVPQQAIIPFKVDHLKGAFCYEILNEDYFSKEGILAYQIQIFSGEQCIENVQHCMWTELITFENP